LPTIGFVHTVHRVIPSLSEITDGLFPQMDQLHYLDESTLKDAIALGGLSADIVRRVCGLVVLAAERSDLVLLTCSSIGPCADIATSLVDVPVLRIDEPMAEEAVGLGRRIGVIATLGSTLGPTVGIIEKCARRTGKQVTIEQVLCEGAFQAAGEGHQEEHDRIVLEGLRRLTDPDDPMDAVVLAQASMARVADKLPSTTKVPILSSPRSGIARAGQVLQQLGTRED